jgi:2,4-dienoyl-CoA reductase-like NADH-dependent reductase (Old Yellow Enzyme family)
VELRPLRHWSPALSDDDIAARIERFAAWIEAAAQAGATGITWG